VLKKNGLFPSVKLENSEKEALLCGYDYLLSRNDFMQTKEFAKAMGKIASSFPHNEMTQNTMIANRFPLAMPQEEIERRYGVISASIANKRVIEMEYTSLDNNTTKRKLSPYKLYMYNNAWFVLGQDGKSGEVRYFKLNRIKSLVETSERFRVPITYNEHDYLDEYGMKQNGEWYPIKLKLTGNYALLAKERIYGKNQMVEAVDESTTILSVEMQNKDDIVSFVLGFRDKCEVLEPEWLRGSIKNNLFEILKKY
jgi:predicted DNA-binding transcriptional regulator YafY